MCTCVIFGPLWLHESNTQHDRQANSKRDLSQSSYCDNTTNTAIYTINAVDNAPLCVMVVHIVNGRHYTTCPLPYTP